MAKPSPFDFVESASFTKIDLLADGERKEGEYSPFLTNRALSYHSDSVLYANEMNSYPGLDNKLQYDYLRSSLRKRSRRSRWFKREDDEVVKLISWRYGLSENKAREAAQVLSVDHVNEIRSQRDSTHE